MKIKFSKVVVAGSMTLSLVLGAASFNQVAANPLPHTTVYGCVDGYTEVVEYGWFGRIRSVTTVACSE